MFRLKSPLLSRFLALSCLVVCSPNVFSVPIERGNDPGGTQRDLTADEINQVKEVLYEKSLKPYSVNLYGLLQGNFYFVDTIRNNTPDFGVSHARLGVLAVEKNWSGKLEVEFIGNQPRTLLPKGSPEIDTPIYLSQSGNNTVSVRQAQINFDFYTHETGGKLDIESKEGEPIQGATALTDDPSAKKDTYLSRVAIGGIRVGGAAATAPDLANTPSGYSRQDGIYLIENMIFGKAMSANLGFGLFNTLSTTYAGSLHNYQIWGAYPGTSSNFLGILGVTSSTFSKAYIFNAGLTKNFSNTKKLNVVGFYGFQNDAPVNTNENGFANTVRNATHVEASALYNDTKLFGGQALLTGNGLVFYFELENGSDQTKTTATPSGLSFKSGDGYTHALYGLSIGGDTANYYTGILKNADRFLYSGSVAVVDAKFKHSEESIGGSPNYTVTQVAGSIGYGYKTLEVFLNGAYSTSPQKAFTYFNKNKPLDSITMQNNRFTAYLGAALYF